MKQLAVYLIVNDIPVIMFREDNNIKMEESSAYGEGQRLRELKSGLEENESYECVDNK